MKTKNSGSKSSALKSSALKSANAKSANVKSITSAKGGSKNGRRSAESEAPPPKPAATAISKVQVIKSTKTITTTKVSVAERLSSAARSAKSAEVVTVKPQALKLKLLAKSTEKIPVSKITRSEPSGMSSKVVTGKFGPDAGVPARPVLAVRAAPVETHLELEPLNGEPVTFKSGDKIVYPGHGVGEIESVQNTMLGGQQHTLYHIKILETGMKVMVPLTQASAVGIRRIIDKKAIDKVYEILRDRDFKIDTQTWNRRFREYSQKIKTGSVYEIAVVLRDLSVLSADKELSFGEKKMLDMAENLLVSEIAIAKARPQDKIVGELRALFA